MIEFFSCEYQGYLRKAAYLVVHIQSLRLSVIRVDSDLVHSLSPQQVVPHALRHSGGEVELVDLVQSYNGVECRDTLLAGIPGESWVRTRTDDGPVLRNHQKLM